MLSNSEVWPLGVARKKGVTLPTRYNMKMKTNHPCTLKSCPPNYKCIFIVLHTMLYTANTLISDRHHCLNIIHIILFFSLLQNYGPHMRQKVWLLYCSHFKTMTPPPQNLTDPYIPWQCLDPKYIWSNWPQIQRLYKGLWLCVLLYNTCQ